MRYMTGLLLIEQEAVHIDVIKCLGWGIDEKFTGLFIDNITEEIYVLDNTEVHKMLESKEVTVINSANDRIMFIGASNLNIKYIDDKNKSTEIGRKQKRYAISTCGDYCRYIGEIVITRRAEEQIIEVEVLECLKNGYTDLEASIEIESDGKFKRIADSLKLMGIQNIIITDFGTALVYMCIHEKNLAIPNGVKRVQFLPTLEKIPGYIENLTLPSSCKTIASAGHEAGGVINIGTLNLGGTELIDYYGLMGVKVRQIKMCESVRRINHNGLGDFKGEANFENTEYVSRIAGYNITQAQFIKFGGDYVVNSEGIVVKSKI